MERRMVKSKAATLDVRMNGFLVGELTIPRLHLSLEFSEGQARQQRKVANHQIMFRAQSTLFSNSRLHFQAGITMISSPFW
jgi:hypothetical protein